MGMFNAASNDGFYDLGLQVSRLIARRLLDPEAADLPRTPAEEAPPQRSPKERKEKRKQERPAEKDIIDLTGED